MDTCPHAPGVGLPIQSIICHNSIVDRHVSTRVLCNDDPQCVGMPPLSGAVVSPALLVCRPVNIKSQGQNIYLSADVGHLEPVQPVLVRVRCGPARDVVPLSRAVAWPWSSDWPRPLWGTPPPPEHAVKAEPRPPGHHKLPAPAPHPAAAHHLVLDGRGKALCNGNVKSKAAFTFLHFSSMEVNYDFSL